MVTRAGNPAEVSRWPSLGNTPIRTAKRRERNTILELSHDLSACASAEGSPYVEIEIVRNCADGAVHQQRMHDSHMKAPRGDGGISRLCRAVSFAATGKIDVDDGTGVVMWTFRIRSEGGGESRLVGSAIAPLVVAGIFERPSQARQCARIRRRRGATTGLPQIPLPGFDFRCGERVAGAVDEVARARTPVWTECARANLIVDGIPDEPLTVVHRVVDWHPVHRPIGIDLVIDFAGAGEDRNAYLGDLWLAGVCLAEVDEVAQVRLIQIGQNPRLNRPAARSLQRVKGVR